MSQLWRYRREQNSVRGSGRVDVWMFGLKYRVCARTRGCRIVIVVTNFVTRRDGNRDAHAERAGEFFDGVRGRVFPVLHAVHRVSAEPFGRLGST
jgi:hypothetical protein